MGKRPRIKKELIGEVIVDELAYVQNKGSKNARKIIEKLEQVHIEIWYDKHYVLRAQLGDDDGDKRHGIDEYIIQDLVSRSIQHLFYYCLKIKNFTFINFGVHTRALRIVLQTGTATGLLNIVVEFHHNH